MRAKKYLQEIHDLVLRLDAAVVVRDPGNARSAEVFEGLRRTIIQTGKSHRSHIAHLLALQESLDRGASIELVKNRVSDFLRELGIEKLTNLEFRDAFEISGGTGEGLELIEPAIVERLSDGSLSVIALGKARRTEIPKEQSAATQEIAVTPNTETQSLKSSDGSASTEPKEEGAK